MSPTLSLSLSLFTRSLSLCISIYIYAQVCVYMYTCMSFIYIYLCTYTKTYVYIYIYMYTYIHVYVYLQKPTYEWIYIYRHTHNNIPSTQQLLGFWLHKAYTLAFLRPDTLHIVHVLGASGYTVSLTPIGTKYKTKEHSAKNIVHDEKSLQTETWTPHYTCM